MACQRSRNFRIARHKRIIVDAGERIRARSYRIKSVFRQMPVKRFLVPMLAVEEVVDDVFRGHR